MSNYCHYKTTLNERRTASFENDPKIIQPKHKRGFFKSFCCIGYEEHEETMIENTLSTSSVTKFNQQFTFNENEFDKEIHAKNIKIFCSSEDLFPSLAKLKKIDLNQSENSQIAREFNLQVQDEMILEYFQKKFFKGNILLTLYRLNLSIIEKALKSCDNLLLLIDEQQKNSQELKSIQELFYQSANGNLILSSKICLHEQFLIDRIIILFQEEDKKDIETQIILDKLEKTIRFLSLLQQPQAINKLKIILPANFEINQLENILCFENRIFYQTFENQKWFEKILDPENYTYTYSKMPKNSIQSQKTIFLQRQLSSKPHIRLNESNNIDQIYNCKSFIKYNQLAGLYVNEQLQCIQVSFKMKIGNISKQKFASVITWMKNKIFFIDELARYDKFSSEESAILEDLILCAPLISCLQAVNYLIMEKIESSCLKNQITHLRYLTILVGSGLLSNAQDLNALQQVFFEVLQIPVVNLKVSPSMSPKNFRVVSHMTGRTMTHKKQISLEVDNIEGYSYDLSQIDKKTQQDNIQDNFDDALFQSDHLEYKRIVSANNPNQKPLIKKSNQSPNNWKSKYHQQTWKEL